MRFGSWRSQKLDNDPYGNCIERRQRNLHLSEKHISVGEEYKQVDLIWMIGDLTRSRTVLLIVAIAFTAVLYIVHYNKLQAPQFSIRHRICIWSPLDRNYLSDPAKSWKPKAINRKTGAIIPFGNWERIISPVMPTVLVGTIFSLDPFSNRFDILRMFSIRVANVETWNVVLVASIANLYTLSYFSLMITSFFIEIIGTTLSYFWSRFMSPSLRSCCTSTSIAVYMEVHLTDIFHRLILTAVPSVSRIDTSL